MAVTQKRFIAGAICPRCKAMDRLVVYEEDGKEFRACVSCDFVEQMYLQSGPRELDTRVNRTEEDKAQAVQTVKLVDPRK